MNQRDVSFLDVRPAQRMTDGCDGHVSLSPNLALDNITGRPIAAACCTALVLAVYLAAAALPLATYTTAIATFGLAHVGSELRYVDYRFGDRLRGGIVPRLVAGLIAALSVRISGMAGWLPYATAIVLELTVVAAMTASMVLSMRQFRAAGAGLAAVLFGGAVLAPLPTFLCLAVAHNLTPLAFLADALDGAERRRVLSILAIPFAALPLTIATGLPQALLASVGLCAPETTVFAGGTLADNLGAYVSPSYFGASWALNVFSAAVFAQCMHYAVVIFVLPRFIEHKAPRRTTLPWPKAPRFILLLAAISFALAVGFTIDYGAARRFYALAALVHGWIEIPILVFALDRSSRGNAGAGFARRKP